MARKYTRNRSGPLFASAAQSLLSAAHDAGLINQTEIAERLGCARQHVSDLVRGAAKPTRRLKERFAADADLQIPVSAWDNPVAAAARARSAPVAERMFPAPIDFEEQRARELEFRAPLSSDATPAFTPPDFSVNGSALDALRQLAEQQAQGVWECSQPFASCEPAVRTKREAEYRRTLGDLAKLQHELAPAEESKLSKSATFGRLCDRLLSALASYPEARIAVLAELDRE